MQFSEKDRTRLLSHREIVKGPEPTPCWLWTLSLRNNRGYGAVRLRGRNFLVHVASYLMHKGPIPNGLELGHLCHVRKCFNPDHLEPVTHTENVLRGRSFNLEKTECLRGHPFRYRICTSTGRLRRYCQTCFNAAQNKKRHESKAEPRD
ncbi:hypothetical protein LCGC14_1371850 [marine sediment metagenome]|uniref:HNH nuclease domain-containing protein n=1 Tax=marine sediment metagenome TaxID=412755 RepID=A0A0F9MKF1_9ZZZZ